MTMRFILLSQDEMKEIKDLYESVMSHASQGLFYREGVVIGGSIVKGAGKDAKLNAMFDEVIRRQWAAKIEFDRLSMKITVKGSAEAGKSDGPTCHRLRGILTTLIEKDIGKKVHCREVECESAGSKECVFTLTTNPGWV